MSQGLIRRFLGAFGIQGPLAVQTIGSLSGGQKARVCMAEMAMREPHLLCLDEPTNHLDLDAIRALCDGLQEFEGGLVMISHHMEAIDRACSQLWVVQADGTVDEFEGSFAEYKEHVLSQHKWEDDSEDE